MLQTDIMATGRAQGSGSRKFGARKSGSTSGCCVSRGHAACSCHNNPFAPVLCQIPCSGVSGNWHRTSAFVRHSSIVPPFFMPSPLTAPLRALSLATLANARWVLVGSMRSLRSRVRLRFGLLRLALPHPFAMATARLRAQWLRGSVVRVCLPLPRPCA